MLKTTANRSRCAGMNVVAVSDHSRLPVPVDTTGLSIISAKTRLAARLHIAWPLLARPPFFFVLRWVFEMNRERERDVIWKNALGVGYIRVYEGE